MKIEHRPDAGARRSMTTPFLHPPILRRLPAAVATKPRALVPCGKGFPALGALHRAQRALIGQRPSRLASGGQGATCQVHWRRSRLTDFSSFASQALAFVNVIGIGARINCPSGPMKPQRAVPRGALPWAASYLFDSMFMVCLLSVCVVGMIKE